MSPGSVRDLERQGQAATERHRIKTSQATASLVQKLDGRQVVVIGYPASVVPPTQQVAATTPPTEPPTVHAPSPQVAQVVAPSAPAVAPSALPKAPAAPAISPEQSARDMLEAWRGAWARGDADWEKQRRARLGNTGIGLLFDNIRIETDNDRAEIRLVQHYTSAQHSDTGEKHLKLKRLAGVWRIIGEDWVPMRAPDVK